MAGDAAGEARVRNEFDLARSRFQRATNNAEAAWRLGRACFELAEAATNRAERAEIAQQGIQACRQSISRNDALAPAHYYLGMNLGQLADTERNLNALRMVREMEREFQAVADLDHHFDYAGADRNLGMLYLQAPVIASIGSRSKARLHLQRAVELAPEYPGNHLGLLEAYLKWNDLNEARRELKELERLWPEARNRFAGPRWAASWQYWEGRLNAAKRRLESLSKPLAAPRDEK
jgi:tetratricopeptide (TPR) repeat protein